MHRGQEFGTVLGTIVRKTGLARFPGAFSGLVVVLGFYTVSLYAQTTASIVGTVRDPSGAVVAKASVTVTNSETEYTRTVATDENGLYVFPLLPIGHYTLTAKHEGFKEAKVAPFILEVAQQARIDLTLSPGVAAEVVDVTGASPLIQTDTSSLGQVIEDRQIVDLPLNSRHVTQLIQLTPGAFTSPVVGSVNSNNGGPPLGTGQGLTNFYEAAISGGGASKTEFLFDGVTDSEQLFGGLQFEPSEDFLGEFRVLSSSFPAQYGGGSAQIVMSSKSGTNALHGTAFEFIRLDSRGFQTDAQNFFAQPGTPLADLHQNQFGGSLGGPVIKNRLFFFIDYDATRQSRPFTQTAAVPTLAERGGNVSTVIGPASVDPYTKAPFPGNQIPANEMSSAAQYFLGQNGPKGAYIVPLPNDPSGVFGIHTFTLSPAAKINSDQGNVRIDYNSSQKDLLFGRFSINDAERVQPGSFPINGGTTATINTKNAAVGYTHIFSSTLLNALRLGIARLYFSNAPQGLGTNYTVASGLLGFGSTSARYPGFPGVGIGDYTGINGNAYAPIINPVHTYTVSDQLTWNKGIHALTIGFDMQHLHMASENAAHSRGTFSFSDGRYSGNGFVDFLMGNPASGFRDYPRDPFGETLFAFPIFIQDDWKVTGNLTVNLGLRYDLAAAPVQDHNANSYFDESRDRWIVSAGSQGQPDLTSQAIAPLAYSVYSPSIVTARQAGLPNNLETMSKKIFAPRVGFAYRPFHDSKTVIRAGYGIFFDPMSGNQTVSTPLINIPFIFDASTPGPTSYPNNGADHFTNYFNIPFASSGSTLIGKQDLNINPPYNQEWNFSLQRELATDLAVQLAYVGNRGVHIDTFIPMNYLRWSNVGGVETDIGRQDATVAVNPAVTGGVSSVPLSGGSNYTDAASSSYNALQATLEKRYSSGLQFTSTFTWSKMIDDGSYDDNTYPGQGGAVQNPNNIHRDRGLAAQDVEFRSTNNVIYALPLGRGMKFGGDIPRGLDYALGGWRVSIIAIAQSGSPFTVTQSSAPFGGEYGNRPNRIGSGQFKNPSIRMWFDPRAFAVVPTNSGIYGNSGRNILRGPGSDNWDLSLMKDFHFTERTYLELRADAFNVFNHPWFGQPDTNIESGTVGIISTTATSANSRELQGSVKVYF